MFKNMQIKKRLRISYTTLLVLLTIGSLVTLTFLRISDKTLRDFYENAYKVSISAADARRDMESVRVDMFKSIIESDLAEIQKNLSAMTNTLQILMDERIPLIRERFDDDTGMVDALEANMIQGKAIREKIFELLMVADKQTVFPIIINEYSPNISRSADLLTEIQHSIEKDADKAIKHARINQRIASVIVLILLLIAIALANLVGHRIITELTSALNDLNKAGKQLAQGDLETIEIKYESQNELGELADNVRILSTFQKEIIFDMVDILNGISRGDFTIKSKNVKAYVGDYEKILMAIQCLRTNMNNTLLQINQSANQVSSGSEQVSGGAQALAQGSTEQASSMEELSATVQDISSAIRSAAEHTNEAHDEVGQAGEALLECNQQMQDMLDAMHEIEEKSTEIGKIMKTIEDIAFQTNLLALNAAVEAARAGSAGKGFAVVADEVRSLAVRSAEASKNSAVLIEASMSAVKKGSELATQTAESLVEIVSRADKTNAAMESVTVETEKLSSAVIDVTASFDQISSVIQTNSATAEESAAASEELSGQAQIMKELVGRFNLEENSEYGSFASAQRSATAYAGYAGSEVSEEIDYATSARRIFEKY